MSNLGISAHNMQLLAQGVRLNMKAEMLRTGKSLLNNQRIVSLHADNSGYRLFAKVKDLSGDDTAYDVTIDVELFRLSKCSCNASEYCAHIAAAFLLAYSMSGHNIDRFAKASSASKSNNADTGATASPKQAAEHKSVPKPGTTQLGRKLSDDWKQALNKNEIIVDSKERALANRNVDQDKHPLPEASQPASLWHRYFDVTLNRLLESNNIQSDIFIKRGLEQLIKHAKDWEPNIRALYELHIRLSLAHHTYRNTNTLFRTDNYNNKYNTSHLLSAFIQELYNNSQSFKWPSFFAQNPERSEELQFLLARYAFNSSSLHAAGYWVELYRMVWGMYLGSVDMTDEAARLQRALGRAKASSVECELIMMALAFFDFRSGDDASAIKRLNKLRHSWEPGVHMTYLYTRRQQHKWNQTLQWLYFMATIAEKQSYGFIIQQEALWGKLFEYWSDGAEAAANPAEWKDWLLSYIDYVFDDYEHLLLSRKQYKQWVDIILYSGRDLEPQYESLLSKLEKSNPEIVLPLYHQYASYWIGRKNRDGYRTAMFVIKKMALMYKRMNDTSGWERYIAHLTQRYSRYRAFQEELRKGKIIA